MKKYTPEEIKALWQMNQQGQFKYFPADTQAMIVDFCHDRASEIDAEINGKHSKESVMNGIKQATTEQLERFAEAKPWWDSGKWAVSTHWVRTLVEVELTERHLGAM